MTARGEVWLVEDDPVIFAASILPERPRVTTLPDDAGFDLGHLDAVWCVTVTTEEDGAAVLDAVARGLDAVVQVIALDEGTEARFVDELRRTAGSVAAAVPPVATDDGGRPTLSEEHRALLQALGEGTTLAAAASSLGIGVRSASRRLAEARLILGVSTTAEAVVRARSSSGSGGA